MNSSKEIENLMMQAMSLKKLILLMITLVSTSSLWAQVACSSLFLMHASAQPVSEKKYYFNDSSAVWVVQNKSETIPEGFKEVAEKIKFVSRKLVDASHSVEVQILQPGQAASFIFPNGPIRMSRVYLQNLQHPHERQDFNSEDSTAKIFAHEYAHSIVEKSMLELQNWNHFHELFQKHSRNEVESGKLEIRIMRMEALMGAYREFLSDLIAALAMQNLNLNGQTSWATAGKNRDWESDYLYRNFDFELSSKTFEGWLAESLRTQDERHDRYTFFFPFRHAVGKMLKNKLDHKVDVSTDLVHIVNLMKKYFLVEFPTIDSADQIDPVVINRDLIEALEKP